MQKSQEKRDILMELTPQILIVVLPLIFLGGFVDSVAGGGGLITLPAYLMAGIPAHLAMGTNKVVNGIGTATASVKYFRGGKIRMRPAVIAGVGALIGAAIGTRIALLCGARALRHLTAVWDENQRTAQLLLFPLALRTVHDCAVTCDAPLPAQALAAGAAVGAAVSVVKYPLDKGYMRKV